MPRQARKTLLLVVSAVACGRATIPSPSPAPGSPIPIGSSGTREPADFLSRAPADARWVGRIIPKDLGGLSTQARELMESAGCDVDLEGISRIDLAVGPTAFVVEVSGTLGVEAARCVAEKIAPDEEPVIKAISTGIRVSSRHLEEGGRGVPQDLRALVDKAPPTASIIAGIPPAASPVTRLVATWLGDFTLQLELVPSASGDLFHWWNEASKSLPPDIRNQLKLTRDDPWISIKMEAKPVLQSTIAAMALRRHVIEAFKVPSSSMAPTLLIGDHIFADKTAATPAKGAMMVFRSPESHQDGSFIKRVIATSGDTVEVLDGRPILNGKLVPHCYVGVLPPAALGGGVNYDPLHTYVEFLEGHAYLTGYVHKPTESACSTDKGCSGSQRCRAGYCGELQGPYHVGNGEGWVLGDNRENSHDSRSWFEGRGGSVPATHWTGRIGFLYLSISPDGAVRWERILNSLQTPTAPGADARMQERVSHCVQSLRGLAQ